MALNQNPFFLPVMQSIDMIAGENARIQGEQRREERQIAAEDRAVTREEDRHQRGLDEQEFGELTKYITDYETNVKGGAEPDPDLLQGVVDRRNALIQEGINPRMLGGAEAPQVPEPGQQPQPGDPNKSMVELSPATARFYGYDPKQPVKRETKRILEHNYRQYHKPDSSKGSGSGKDPDDPLKIIGDMRKRAQSVVDKGRKEAQDTENVGIQQDILREYLDEVQAIEQDFRAGTLSKSEARMKAVQLGSFDQFLALHGADRDKITERQDRQTEALEKIAND